MFESGKYKRQKIVTLARALPDRKIAYTHLLIHTLSSSNYKGVEIHSFTLNIISKRTELNEDNSC